MAEIKLRINQELKDDLKQIAKREGRSLNKQVEIFLEFAKGYYLHKDQKRISVKLEGL